MPLFPSAFTVPMSTHYPTHLYKKKKRYGRGQRLILSRIRFILWISLLSNTSRNYTTLWGHFLICLFMDLLWNLKACHIREKQQSETFTGLGLVLESTAVLLRFVSILDKEDTGFLFQDWSRPQRDVH